MELTNNNMKYDVDVVVCCYNPAFEQLKKTIISIYNQKGVKYHLIISDDGSKIQYKDLLIKFLKKINLDDYTLNFLEENVGTIKNIYSSLVLCKSEYIKTISPGDYLFDEHSLYNLCMKITSEEADAVFGKQQYYRDDTLFDCMAPANMKLYDHPKNIKKEVLKYHSCLINGASLIYKIESVKESLKILFSLKMRLVEDNPSITLLLLKGKRITCIPEYVVWYEHKTGVSSDPTNKTVLNDFKFFDDYYKTLSESVPYIKYLVKTQRINKIKNNALRKVAKMVFLPGHTLYFLFNHLNNQPTKNTIDMMEHITTINNEEFTAH